MATLNLDGISLLAFSSQEALASWREDVKSQERAKDQRLDVTRYSRTGHTDTYSRGTHTDIYSRTDKRDSYSEIKRVNRYTNTAHTNSYSDRTRTSYSNSYSKSSHKDRYSRNYNTYVRVGSYNNRTYSKRGTGYITGTAYAAYVARYTQNSYSKSARRNTYTDYYSKRYSNYYTKRASVNDYSETPHTNRYTEVAAVDSYNKVAESDTYSEKASYSKGFDHENYIPSTPEVYNVQEKTASPTGLAAHINNSTVYHPPVA